MSGPAVPGRLALHEMWMRRAIEVALSSDVLSSDVLSPGVLSPGADVPSSVADVPSSVADVPVGAVLYGPDGTELGCGGNERERTGDPTAHAEILALRRAASGREGWRLDGCTLVVTLEPCTMCAGALVLARVQAVVFGAWEPKTGAVGSLWDVVRDPRLNHRPDVYSGVLESECAALVRGFFTDRRP